MDSLTSAVRIATFKKILAADPENTGAAYYLANLEKSGTDCGLKYPASGHYHYANGSCDDEPRNIDGGR